MSSSQVQIDFTEVLEFTPCAHQMCSSTTKFRVSKAKAHREVTQSDAREHKPPAPSPMVRR